MTWTKELQERLKAEIIPSLKEEILKLNDDMAEHPELGSREYVSSQKIVELLRGHGMEVTYPYCGLETAFRASVNPGGKKKAVLMAEYDALPEIGHACGHCASGMASVMAVLAFNQIRSQLEDIQIDIIGTPDEEWTGGKALLVKAGAFEDCDFAAMVHMNGFNAVNVSFSALDAMKFEFHGRPAHAAACPEKGRNALNAARLLFDSVDMMRQHVVSDARMHGYIRDGGSASNIVPDFTSVEFVTRAGRRTDLEDITSWVQDCARAAALATRTEVTIEPQGESFDDFQTGPEKRRLLFQCFDALGLPVDPDASLCGGSSDVGNVDMVCPAFHPMMSIGQNLDAHTREFAGAMTNSGTHEAIVNSARLLAELCWRLLTRPEQLELIQKEHRAQRGRG